MNDQTQMMNRSFPIWHPPPPIGGGDPMKFQNPRFAGPHPKKKFSRFAPPARRFNQKKKFSRFAPYAPRNTTSFIIRAKRSGGIADLVSPCPVTPAILPTPKFSPTREGLVDMARAEWGVDGYGSMKGLIRLRKDDADVEEGGASDVEVMDDQGLSRRFEMVSVGTGGELELRVDDQDLQIAKLEEENLTLKERVFLVEEEMVELRRRLQFLENNVINNNNNNNNNNNDQECSYSGNNDNVTNANDDEDGGGDVCEERSTDCDATARAE